MATPSPVRLLIADLSENRAHEIDSVLRDAGISTRPEFFSDLTEAAESASVDRLDLMLCNAGFEQLDQLLPGLRTREPDLPIIVHDDTPEAANLTRGMALGATDVVFRDDNERLLYVVKRELHHVCRHQRLVQTDRALKEAERRCELLLANSTAAIAYVHEGMHIYANDDYLTLFGFEDADDLLGLPLLDLIDAEDANTFKSHMKAFRSHEANGAAHEASFAVTGRTLDGEPVQAEMTLSSAEYEGEPCTQVLVRRVGDQPAAATAAPAVTETDEVPEPVLLEVSEQAETDGAAAETAAPQTGAAPPKAAAAAPQTGAPAPQTGAAAPKAAAAAPASAAPEQASAPARAPAADAISGFVERATLEIKRAGSGTLLVIEIDDFDEMQVEHGLSESKSIVAEIARWFAEDLTNVLAEPIADHRFGLVAFGSEASGDVLAEQIRAQVEDELFDVNGRTIRCSVTIGAVTVNPSLQLRDSVDLAFKAMLAARETKGNNSVLWYQAEDSLDDDDGLDEQQRRILALVNEAIEGNRFVLLFQPIISLRGDSDEHYEVFLRLTGDDNEQLVPADFLELAIEHGVAGKIDRWVILHSIKLLSAHRAEGHNTRLTINLTSNSLIDEEFVQWLAVAIKAARLPSDAVVFQIAEPDAAQHVRAAADFVQGLKNMHCRSGLRHFGLSESSFETLSNVAVDFVKLDGSRVQEIQDDPDKREELTEVISQLQGMGKLTVIPMVESATLLSALWQAGANYIQGHYLQEPTPEMNYDFSTDD